MTKRAQHAFPDPPNRAGGLNDGAPLQHVRADDEATRFADRARKAARKGKPVKGARPAALAAPLGWTPAKPLPPMGLDDDK